MKTSLTLVVPLMLAALLLPVYASAQVNSGSDGHDGALNPTANLVIDMADHLDGIYHYTSVNIPAGVTVSFIPNAGNKPVVWLVQGDCNISGSVSVNGGNGTASGPGGGGPGGYGGGNGGSNATAGQGPGAGYTGFYGGNASFGAVGNQSNLSIPFGSIYGNIFLLPLLGGSGGGGGTSTGANASGGGGAILIAVNGQMVITGGISAVGGDAIVSYNPFGTNFVGGAGSGGGIRLMASRISGSGSIVASGGQGGYHPSVEVLRAGVGRVRFDTFANSFSGSIAGTFSQGFQPIIFPSAGQGLQLNVASVGGVAVAPSPGGVLVNPDVIIPAQQANPIPIVVHCTNIPLNTEISVVVHPANGPDMQAVGSNNVGTLASSSVTVLLDMPRGGGIIYARAVTGIAGTVLTLTGVDSKARSLAETGWTADGETFVAMEIKAGLGGRQSIAYLTKSGKRYSID